MKTIFVDDTEEGKVYRIEKWGCRGDWLGTWMQRRGDQLISVGEMYGQIDWGEFHLPFGQSDKNVYRVMEIPQEEVMEEGFRYYENLGWRKEQFPFKLTLSCYCECPEFLDTSGHDEFGVSFIVSNDLNTLELATITESQPLFYTGSVESLVEFLKKGVPSWLVLPEKICVSQPFPQF